MDEINEYKIAKVVSFHLMGEPLLHPNFFEIVDYAKRYGLKISLFTNGSLLTKEISKKIIKSNIDEIHISLQTPNEFYYKNLRKTKIKWNDYIKRIENFINIISNSRSSSIVFLEIGITKNNWFKNFFKYNITNFKIIENRNELKNVLDKWNLFLNKTKYNGKIILKNGYLYKIHKNIFIRLEYIFPWYLMFSNKYKSYFEKCFPPRDHFAILSNGDVTLCCVDFKGNLKIGNIKQSSLISILSSKRLKRFLYYLSKNRMVEGYCQRCVGQNSIPALYLYQLYIIFNYIKSKFYSNS